MPRVPVYQPSVNEVTPQVAAPQVMHPPEEAFGADVANANANLGGTVEKVGQMIGQRVIEMQQREDDKQTMNVATQFQQDLQNKLNDDTPDPKTGSPQGFLAKNGAQAVGSTVAFDQTAQQMKQDYLSQVKGPMQQVDLSKVLDVHLLNARDQVIHHETAERDADLKNTFATNQKVAIDAAAGLSDPDSVTRAMIAAKTLASPMYQHLGYSPEIIKNQDIMLNGQMVRSAVTGNLDANPKAAEAVLEAHKADIPASDYVDLTRLVQGKKIFDTQVNTWNALKGQTLGDGMSDLETMQKSVYSMDVPTEQKDKLWEFVKANAHTQDSEVLKQRASTDRDFMNQVIQLKQQGGGLADALKLAPNFAFDTEDAQMKQDAIKKMYEGKNETDPLQYVTLWDKVQAGQATNRDLVQSLGNGDVSQNDFRELWKENAKTKIDGSTPAEKDVNSRIKILAEQNFGSDKDKAASYEYTVNAMTRGQSPQEKWKTAQDYLKNDPSSGWIFKDKQYVTNMKQLDAQNTGWGQVYSDIGRRQANEIGKGLLLKGSPQWSLNDVASFANQFGGMENLKPGKPAGNAIQSLMAKGLPVTAGNMKVLLDKHPDGNY